MSKLTYWCCNCLHDAPCYNLRARTKQAAEQLRKEQDPTGTEYAPAHKVEVEYYGGAFGLLEEVLGEGGVE